MDFKDEMEAKSYAVIYSIVYQFGKVGLDIEQIREFTDQLNDDVFDMIADSWLDVLFDEKLQLKENGDLVMNQKSKRLVALQQIQKAQKEMGIFDQDEDHEEIIEKFAEQLNDIKPEDFLDE